MRSTASPTSSASTVAPAASPSLAVTREGPPRRAGPATSLEQRINKRRGGLAGHHQHDHQRQDEHEGHDPVHLVLAAGPEKRPHHPAHLTQPNQGGVFPARPPGGGRRRTHRRHPTPPPPPLPLLLAPSRD